MKQFVVFLISLSVFVSLSASIYYAIQYFKYADITRTEMALSAFIDSKTEVKEVKNLLNSYTTQVTVNAYNDSINAAFEPNIEVIPRSGFDTDYDPRTNLHVLGESFSLGELAFLNHKRIPKSFAWTSNLNSLDVPDIIYAYSGQEGEADALYARGVQSNSFNALIGTISDFVLGMLLLFFVLKGVKHELYKKDFIFVRYDFINKSHLIGRRLISIFLNVFLLIGCMVTVMISTIFYKDKLFSPYYDSSWIPCGLTYFMAFLALFYVLTSGIWWILGKNEPAPDKL